MRYSLTAAGRKAAEKAVAAAGTAKAAALRPVSLMNAAIAVAKAAKGPMKCREMFEQITKKGLWASPEGKTPVATLGAKILCDARSEKPRWRKVDRGTWELTRYGRQD